MKSRTLISLTISLLLILTNPPRLLAQDYPPARFQHAMAADESHLYMFAGFVETEGMPGQQGITGDYDVENDLWVFDFDNMTWTKVESSAMPEKRSGHSMFILDGKLYTFAGRGSDNDNNLRSTDVCDLSTGEWQQANPSGPLPPNLAYYASALINNSWFILGGWENYNSDGYQVTGVTNYLFQYQTVENRWNDIVFNPSPHKLQQSKAVEYNGQMWAVGGRDENGNYSNKLTSYDPATNTYTDHTPANPGDNWPDARSHHQWAVGQGGIHLTGGKGNDGNKRDHWLFNPDQVEWAKQEDVPEEVYLKSAEAVTGPDEAIYYFGGEENNEPLDNFYKLQNDQWSKFDKNNRLWRRIGANTFFLNMVIEPSEAAEAGCTVDPAPGQHEYDPETVVDLTATEQPEEGWFFKEWTGVPGGANKTTLVTMNEDKIATAHFKEVKLVVTGSLDTTFCRCALDGESQTVNLMRATAYGDDWVISGLNITAPEESGNELTQLVSVWVTHGNTKLWEGTYTQDNGSISATLDPVVSVPETETVTLAIHYEFNQIPDEAIETEILSFPTQVTPDAMPEHYDTGLVLGQGSGMVRIARVWNNKHQAYPTIQAAVNGTDLGTIYLCPETFNEEVKINKVYLTLLTPDEFGRRARVESSSANTVVFSIPGFGITIRNIDLISSSPDRTFGFLVLDHDFILENSNISGFDTGIDLNKLHDVSLKNVECLFNHNGLSGYQVKNLTIENSSFFQNDKNGIKLQDATNTRLSGSKLNQNNTGLYAETTHGYLTINQCQFNNNKETGLYHKYILGTTTITQSTFSENRSFGLRQESGQKISVSSCQFIDNYFEIDPAGATGTGFVLQYGTATIANSLFSGNCSGIKLYEAKVNLHGNTIEESRCWNTGIEFFASNGEISGNRIEQNHGAGILTGTGSQPEIHGNNISGNTTGLENQDPTTPINARGNYWGTPDGPGEQDVSGQVETEGFLDEAVEVVVSFDADSLFMLPNQEDSVCIYLQNLIDASDQLQLSWSDQQGWISETARSEAELDETGASFWIPVETAAEESPANALSVLAQSLNDPLQTATDTVILMTYHPVMSRVNIQPDSILVRPGDTLALSASGYDQYRHSLSGDWIWNSTSGEITLHDELVAPNNEGLITLTVQDATSGFEQQAFLYCTSEDPVVQTLYLIPSLDSVVPGMDLFIDWKAWDQFGFPTRCEPEWSCEGGTIDSNGLFTAGETLGWASITGTDPFSGVSATIQIKIVGALGTDPFLYSDAFRLYPNPANDQLIIESLLEPDEPVILRIMNSLGQVIYQKQEITPDQDRFSVNIRNFPAGLYLVTMESSGMTYREKLIIQR